MDKLTRLQIAKDYYPLATPELNYESDFQLLIAVMLSAQTTDKAVNKATADLFRKYPTAKSLGDADYDQIYATISKLGLAKTKAKNAKIIGEIFNTKFNNILPNSREELIKLPGVGIKTANVVLAIIYDLPYMAVDTHVLRICKRLKIVPEHRNEQYAEKTLERLLVNENINQYHQSLIYFGRYHCKARNPNCENCKLQAECRYYLKNN